MKYGCPVCRKSLIRWMVPDKGFYYKCTVHGLWMSFGFAKGGQNSEFILSEIQKTLTVYNGKLCPNCNKKMTQTFISQAKGVTLDSCSRCKGIWFDVGEVERILPDSEAAAKFKVALPSSTSSSAIEYHAGENHFDPLHFLGFPTEVSTKAVHTFPIATTTIVFLCLLGTIAIHRNPQEWMTLAFYPIQPLANFGKNLIVSIFLHADIFHFVGNAYFLFLCGDNIEDEIGPLNLFFLFLLGSIVGKVAYLSSGSEIPSIGASGGVYAMLAFYALAFPNNRIRDSYFFFFRGGFQNFHFSVSAPMFFGIYFLWEIFGSLAQWGSGVGGVNHLAHVGGAVAGLIFFALYPPNEGPANNKPS